MLIGARKLQAMIGIAQVELAAKRLAGRIADTPCVESQLLSELTGCRVHLKFENLQYTASFKERGACNKLLQLDADERSRGVIAMSAGNHAQGVAYHARKLGMHSVIVMPRFTPMVKVDRTRALGADVVLHGELLEEARSHALELARARGMTFIHPFDDVDVIAGQGTITLEMLRAVPDLDTLVVAIGGGGLIGGMAAAAKAIKPGIRVVGVQTARFPSMFNAVKGGMNAVGTSTIAEGIAVQTPGLLTRALVERYVDDIVLVDEGDIEQAIVMLLEIEKTLTEGAGAASLAALLRHGSTFAGKKVGLVLSGGNIDPMLLASIIQRGLVRAGRLARLKVCTRDVPGTLATISAVVSAAGANIDEVHHQRAFTALAAQNVEVQLVVQTRGAEHIQAVLAALRAGGFEASQE
jgi:threonine dehydratase